MSDGAYSYIHMTSNVLHTLGDLQNWSNDENSSINLLEAACSTSSNHLETHEIAQEYVGQLGGFTDTDLNSTISSLA
jgi:hypothetical protein